VVVVGLQPARRAYLFRFDTTEALTYFRRARELSPHDLAIRDFVAKLEAARMAPSDLALGRTVFEPIVAKVDGAPRTLSLAVTLTRDGAVTKGRVFVNGDTGVVASEAVVGATTVWSRPVFGTIPRASVDCGVYRVPPERDPRLGE
jgi:hypothetical protein